MVTQYSKFQTEKEKEVYLAGQKVYKGTNLFLLNADILMTMTIIQQGYEALSDLY